MWTLRNLTSLFLSFSHLTTIIYLSTHSQGESGERFYLNCLLLSPSLPLCLFVTLLLTVSLPLTAHLLLRREAFSPLRSPRMITFTASWGNRLPSSLATVHSFTHSMILVSDIIQHSFITYFDERFILSNQFDSSHTLLFHSVSLSLPLAECLLQFVVFFLRSVLLLLCFRDISHCARWNVDWHSTQTSLCNCFSRVPWAVGKHLWRKWRNSLSQCAWVFHFSSSPSLTVSRDSLCSRAGEFHYENVKFAEYHLPGTKGRESDGVSDSTYLAYCVGVNAYVVSYRHLVQPFPFPPQGLPSSCLSAIVSPSFLLFYLLWPEINLSPHITVYWQLSYLSSCTPTHSLGEEERETDTESRAAGWLFFASVHMVIIHTVLAAHWRRDSCLLIFYKSLMIRIITICARVDASVTRASLQCVRVSRSRCHRYALILRMKQWTTCQVHSLQVQYGILLMTKRASTCHALHWQMLCLSWPQLPLCCLVSWLSMCYYLYSISLCNLTHSSTVIMTLDKHKYTSTHMSINLHRSLCTSVLQ